MTTPTLESALESFSIFDEPCPEHFKACMSEILPAVRRLADRGIPANAIIAALARATVATVNPGMLERIFLIAAE